MESPGRDDTFEADRERMKQLEDQNMWLREQNEQLRGALDVADRMLGDKRVKKDEREFIHRAKAPPPMPPS